MAMLILLAIINPVLALVQPPHQSVYKAAEHKPEHGKHNHNHVPIVPQRLLCSAASTSRFKERTPPRSPFFDWPCFYSMKPGIRMRYFLPCTTLRSFVSHLAHCCHYSFTFDNNHLIGCRSVCSN